MFLELVSRLLWVVLGCFFGLMYVVDVLIVWCLFLSVISIVVVFFCGVVLVFDDMLLVVCLCVWVVFLLWFVLG